MEVFWDERRVGLCKGRSWRKKVNEDLNLLSKKTVICT